MSKITSTGTTYYLVYLVYLVASLYFTLEKTPKDVTNHTICMHYEAKI